MEGLESFPPVTIQIIIGQSFTRCASCFSCRLQAVPAGLICAFCKEPITETDLKDLMAAALKRDQELKAGITK